MSSVSGPEGVRPGDGTTRSSSPKPLSEADTKTHAAAHTVFAAPASSNPKSFHASKRGDASDAAQAIEQTGAIAKKTFGSLEMVVKDPVQQRAISTLEKNVDAVLAVLHRINPKMAKHVIHFCGVLSQNFTSLQKFLADPEKFQKTLKDIQIGLVEFQKNVAGYINQADKIVLDALRRALDALTKP